MSRYTHQRDLFQSQSLNITYETKRIIRLELEEAKRKNLSRDQVVEQMSKEAWP